MKKNIIELSNISDGSLLACCRKSKAFTLIENSYVELDKVREAWRTFLAHSETTSQCKTWVDAWMAFCAHSDFQELGGNENQRINNIELRCPFI